MLLFVDDSPLTLQMVCCDTCYLQDLHIQPVDYRAVYTDAFNTQSESDRMRTFSETKHNGVSVHLTGPVKPPDPRDDPLSAQDKGLLLLFNPI